ncbi:MAG: hypothetical protein ACUZ9M_08730, partial [Candidatus Scalindua sp.]
VQTSCLRPCLKSRHPNFQSVFFKALRFIISLYTHMCTYQAVIFWFNGKWVEIMVDNYQYNY